MKTDFGFEFDTETLQVNSTKAREVFEGSLPKGITMETVDTVNRYCGEFASDFNAAADDYILSQDNLLATLFNADGQMPKEAAASFTTTGRISETMELGALTEISYADGAFESSTTCFFDREFEVNLEESNEKLIDGLTALLAEFAIDEVDDAA